MSDSINVAHNKNENQAQKLDALIVGAGFGGVYQLKKLRDEGYNVKLVEAGDDYGGVWYWNRYPGARVDSATPFYQFSDQDLWEDWTWSQRFPSSTEIRAYFAHVARKWDLRKDTNFNTVVSSGTWDDNEALWNVQTTQGGLYKAKYFLLSVGFAAKRYIPNWKGIDCFKGTFIHPSYWPHDEPDLNGKKVAIIGTGATGVQLTTTVSKVVSQLTVFQRTPCTALPMRQVDYGLVNQTDQPNAPKAELFQGRTKSFGGFDFNFLPRATFDDTPSERLATYESLWAEGDFKYWLATYHDMLFVKEANDAAYDFWCDKTRAKLHDAKIAEKLAPIKPQYAFGCKRIPLELGYFETFNEPHVSLVDVNATPIEEITESGIRTSEKEMQFDYIICATGYDAVTGGFAQIGIKGIEGYTLKKHWADGAKTYLGMCVAGFPNMFFTYGPQAPTTLCNGPTCAELQGDWIVEVINYMKEKKMKKISARGESEAMWKEQVWGAANSTLLPSTRSWYMGDNIPGKPREPLFYLGGVPTYYKAINEEAANSYVGFELS